MRGSGSTPVSAMRPAKMDRIEGGLSRDGIDKLVDLLGREDSGDIHLDAVGRKALDQRGSGLTLGVERRDLNVDVVCPVAISRASASIPASSSANTSKETDTSVMCSRTVLAKAR